ncbi:MAG: SET domain-containing protein-lysine N-methyltransferase [Gammaproteobacteria bacterium]|nr:MAG: SET domain-containing protein-lysine N-methyltransferase [Gammaproteobacteria bacterium]
MLIYPFDLDLNSNYPTHSEFVVKHGKENKGSGVFVKTAYRRGQLVARFTGHIVPHVIQHTLQITSTTHLHDIYFSGLLFHSCNPNIFVDMQKFEIWAIQDIRAGEALAMDYASTEDVLFKQFQCFCKSPNCRKWITGRKEKVNQVGMDYLKSLEVY